MPRRRSVGPRCDHLGHTVVDEAIDLDGDVAIGPIAEGRRCRRQHRDIKTLAIHRRQLCLDVDEFGKQRVHIALIVNHPARVALPFDARRDAGRRGLDG